MSTKTEFIRLGFIGIVLADNGKSAPAVNAILTEHAQFIVGRMGIPRGPRESAVITLIVEATTDRIGQLTGRLGQLPGVEVRSALTR